MDTALRRSSEQSDEVRAVLDDVKRILSGVQASVDKLEQRLANGSNDMMLEDYRAPDENMPVSGETTQISPRNGDAPSIHVPRGSRASPREDLVGLNYATGWCLKHRCVCALNVL